MNRCFFPAILFFTCLLAGCQKQADLLKISELMTESHLNPSGIDTPKPRFGWKMQSGGYDQVQTAYQVLVASSESRLSEDQADLWNTGKVAGSQSVWVPFAGKPLASSTPYFWKVRVWDKDGNPSDWSQTARFITGILRPEEWKAQWVGAWFPDTYAHQWQYGKWIGSGQDNRGEAFFRKSFQVEQPGQVEKATLRVHGSGKSYIYLNGQRVKECAHWVGMYEIELDFRLKAGKNVLAIQMRDREGNRPDLLASLIIQRKDGTTAQILSDETWKVRPISAPSEWAQTFYYDEDWASAVPAEETRRNPRRPEFGPQAINLRKEISLKEKPESALVHISGLGSYQLYINGKKVSPDLLTPGWTEFDQRVEYQTYDVKDLLTGGQNTLGIMLGNSWWQFHLQNFQKGGVDTLLKALMQLELKFADGSAQTVITDPTWKAAPSAVAMNHIWHGEVYDFRREEQGWMLNGFDDRAWKPTVSVAYPVPLVAQMAEPIVVTQTLRPLSVRPTRYGSWIVDFGQNIAGWVSLQVPKRPTEKIMVQYAEVQNPDGSLFLGNLRSAKSMNKYYLTGQEKGTLEPHFTYHGFRYVEIFGYPETLRPEQLTAKVIHTDVRPAGEFACSNPLLNQLFRNEQWTFRGNFYAVPTDCPQRDERLGWMADAGNIPTTAAYFYNVHRYFDKWVYDMKTSQQMSGYFPNYSPSMGGSAFGARKGAPGWADAGVKVPFTLYQFYGDTLLLQNHYPAMKAHVDSMRAESQGNLYERGGWGDWLPVEPSPAEPFGSAYYFYSTNVLAKTAYILGRPAEARFYDSLAAEIAKAFHAKHFNPQTNDYANGTQASNILPLSFGITPPELREKVMQRVLDDIGAKEYHLTTGFLGTTFLIPELSRHGHDEVAYRIMTQRDYPSFGRIMDAGATTVTEAWNAYLGEDFASHNHFNLASVTEWFFSGLAGIQPDDYAPGFKQFIIRPVILDDLTFAKASYETNYGTIRSAWKKADGKLILEVEIPVNTTAAVYVPSGGVLQSGTAKQPAPTPEGTYNRYLLGSGKYVFVSDK